MKQNVVNNGLTEWFDIKQITSYVNVSERTVRAWIHMPLDPLPAVRVLGKILVRRSELDAWLGRRRIKDSAKIDLDNIVSNVLRGVARER